MGERRQNEVKISIIMPIYNAEAFLKDSLDDIIGQTLKEFELICINDGSTDNSQNMLKEYSCQDDRIKVICQDNKGPGIARNTGVCRASGKYLLFLDSDDRFEEDLLELIYRCAEENEADIVVYNADMFDTSTGAVIDAPWLFQSCRYIHPCDISECSDCNT